MSCEGCPPYLCVPTCGITDAWARTETDTWGESDAGLTWETATDGWNVLDGTATMTREFAGAPINGLEFGPLVFTEVRFWFDYAAVADAIWIINLDGEGIGSNNYVSFDLFTDEGHVYLNRDGGAGNDAAGLFSGKTEVRLRCDAVGTYAKLWPYGDPEPLGWSLVDEPGAPEDFAGDGFSFSMDAIAPAAVVITVGPLSITDVDVCLFSPITESNRAQIRNEDGVFTTTLPAIADIGLIASWTTHAATSPLDQEIRRYWTITLPAGTQRVRVYGGVYGQNLTGPAGVGFEHTTGSITHVHFDDPDDPDWEPTYLGAIVGVDGMVNLDSSLIVLGSFDVTIDIAPDETTFQMMIVNTSPEGTSAAGVGPRGGGAPGDPIVAASVYMWATAIFFDDYLRMEVSAGDPATGGCVEPMANQPVLDEPIGTGDGTTTVFNTNWPYNPASLQVEVASLLGEVDPTDPAARRFTLTPAPPLGAPIYATYRAARF